MKSEICAIEKKERERFEGERKIRFFKKEKNFFVLTISRPVSDLLGG